MPIRPLGSVSNARPSARVRSEGAAERRSLDSGRDKYKNEMQIVKRTGRKSVEAYWENVIGELSGPDPDLVKSYMRPTVSSIVKRNAWRTGLEGIPECDYESSYLDDEMHAFIEHWLEDACPSECGTDTMSDGVMAAVPIPRFSESESIPTDEFQRLVRGASTEFLALVDTLNNRPDPEVFSFALHETEVRAWPRQAGKGGLHNAVKTEEVQTDMGAQGEDEVQPDCTKACNPWGKVVSFAAGAGTALGLVLLKQ
ncbi:hypothetical protein BSKO_07798 [Bryopsis sp. KO-2023]|nr:hypothetical protein BSKO_07798 [Bryopsis sp. KO-2023]